MFDRKAHCRKIASKGGRATVEKHGRVHMAKIGRKGYEKTSERYKFVPVQTLPFNERQGSLVGWALVRRDTNEVIKIIG